MEDFSKELSAAKDIAHQAGEVILKYFRVSNDEVRKNDGSPVTIADKTINHMAIEEITKRFKDVVIGEEESSGEYGMGRRWICDPVDGTKAYVWGVPTAMFSLGFVIGGVPIMGVAYDPFLNNLYEAVQGNGSFCNGKPIRVSQKGIRDGYIVMTSSPREIVKHGKRTSYLIEQGAQLATFSGAVYKMCLVGQGFFLGYFEQGAGTHDVAAGHVIVEEAGGKVTGLDGLPLNYSAPFKGVVLSNGLVHDQIIEAIKNDP